MTRIDSVDQREEILAAVCDHGEPAVILKGTRPYILTECENGYRWAWSDEESGWQDADELPLPWTLLHVPGRDLVQEVQANAWLEGYEWADSYFPADDPPRYYTDNPYLPKEAP